MNDEPQQRGGPAGHGGRGSHGRGRRGARRWPGTRGGPHTHGRRPRANGAPSGPGRPSGATHLSATRGPGGQPGDQSRKDRRRLRRESRKERRREKRRRRKRTGWRRTLPTWRMSLSGLGVLLVLLTGAFVAGYLLVTIPAANATATAQSNVFLYADGTQLARDGDINRENASLARIPKSVQRAVLAAEDRDFYSEHGVDPLAMVRGLWNTASGKGRQSGSTITQQYVKNYYLDQEQTVTRKVKELFIAIKLDREHSKKDIFQGYLNTSYFGRNTYGIQAAAQAYYGVDAWDLTTAQGAYLASLLNAPSAYDVLTHPENKSRAVARWNYVLDGMVKEHWLSRTVRAHTAFPTPRRAKAQSGLSGQRGYVVQAVKDYLTSHHIIDERAHGYRITTTLRRRQQEDFSAAVHEQLLSRLDTRARKVDRTVRAGGAAIDPASGKVIAMYGGIDYTKQFVNNATRRDYQVGSAFKPFVFAAAVQHGAVTQSGGPINPNAMYDGTDRRPVQGWNGPRYAPQNEDNRSYGPINVRTATNKSVNAVYAQMAVDVGPAKVKSTAIGLGLPRNTRDMPEGPAIALGTATASALDLAQAYATLANHGSHLPYTLVEKVTKDGRTVHLPGRKASQAVSREAADTTTEILQGVVEGGTGTAAQAAGRPAAGKTGTAENDTAAWFAGYTPDLATVVTVMGQDPRTGAHTPLYGALGESRMNGGGYPAEIWARFTGRALGKAARSFELQLQPGSEESASPSPGDSPSGDNTGGETGADTGGPTGGADSAGTDGTGGTGGTDGTGGTGGTTDTGGAGDVGGASGSGGTGDTGGAGGTDDSGDAGGTGGWDATGPGRARDDGKQPAGTQTPRGRPGPEGTPPRARPPDHHAAGPAEPQDSGTAAPDQPTDSGRPVDTDDTGAYGPTAPGPPWPTEQGSTGFPRPGGGPDGTDAFRRGAPGPQQGAGTRRPGPGQQS